MFCSEATLTAEADIVMTKDIRHSRVTTLGYIKCGGSIIG
jgi:hypothetical protein